MSKTLAYVRTSTEKQDLNTQKLEILEYARRHGLQIADFIEISISSRKNRRERRIDEVVERLDRGDILIVTELSRLGRSTGEMLNLIDELVHGQIRVIIIKQNLILETNQDDMQSLTMITLFSLFAQLERVLISQRTKEALAAKKARRVRLGKPKGVMQKSMYDKERERIIELLSLGVPARRISYHHLAYGHPSSLNYYIDTRNLRQAACEQSKQSGRSTTKLQ